MNKAKELIEEIEDKILGVQDVVRGLKEEILYDKPKHDTSFQDNRKELLKEVDFILREKIEKKAPKPLWQKVCKWANEKFKYTWTKDKVNVWEYLWTRVSRLSNEEMKEFIDLIKGG